MEHPRRPAFRVDGLLSGDLSSPFPSSHLHHFLSAHYELARTLTNSAELSFATLRRADFESTNSELC
jgi:hypothetical protein